MHRRIDRLIGDIDQLIDEGLARGERDGDIGQAVCKLCGGDWHGAPADATTAGEYHRITNCPGAFATPEQRVHWLRRTRTSLSSTITSRRYESSAAASSFSALTHARSVVTARGRVPCRNANCTAAQRYPYPYGRLAPSEPEDQLAP